MILGAHVTSAGGLGNSIKKATSIGAQAMQIFASPPQNFNPPNHPDESIEEFKNLVQENDLGPVFLHAIYLINLGSPNPDLVQKSINSLVADLVFAAKIGAVGVIYHTGSTLGRDFREVRSQITKAMAQILASSPSSAQLIVENAAGQGAVIGDNFTEIGQMLGDLADNRVRSCLDTQHAFASGYDLRTVAGLEKTLAEWDREVGLDKLVCLHVNDSKVEFGSGRDRHENIGQGLMGIESFRLLKQNPLTHSLPWILEVPGMDGKGPDAANLDILRHL